MDTEITTGSKLRSPVKSPVKFLQLEDDFTMAQENAAGNWPQSNSPTSSRFKSPVSVSQIDDTVEDEETSTVEIPSVGLLSGSKGLIDTSPPKPQFGPRSGSMSPNKVLAIPIPNSSLSSTQYPEKEKSSLLSVQKGLDLSEESINSTLQPDVISISPSKLPTKSIEQSVDNTMCQMNLSYNQSMKL